MSSINRLIRELCPNGVEKVSLGSLMKRIKEKNYDGFGIKTVYSVTKENGIVKSDDLHDFSIYSNDLSNYNILRKNQFAYNPARLNIGSIARLKNDEAGLVSPMYVIFELDQSRIDFEYFEHLLFSQKVFSDMCSFVEQGARFRFDYKNWNKIIIELPPLKIQKEIVRILNKFLDMQNILEVELEARKSQYEFWRDKVFEPKETWTSKTMEELCTIITKQTGFDYSSTIKPSLLDSKSSDTYSFIQNKDFDGTRFNFDTDYYIPIKVANKYPKITLDSPSILFSISGRIGNVGLYESKEKAFIGGAIAICKLKPNLNNKYILYYLQSKYGQQYLFGNIKAASHLNVTVEAIRKIDIKFPSLDKQNRIVDILDKFDALVNDKMVGLPAEIELRRKQYEYYRNKLLSFEEL